MARPRTPTGSHGSISTRQVSSKTWQAQTRIRDLDGESRIVRARSTTQAKAVGALRERLLTRRTPGGGALGPSSTVGSAADSWLASLRRSPLAPSTIERYEMAANKHITPRLGRLELRALTAGGVTHFLQELPANHKLVRTVLNQIMQWAVNEDAIQMNPVKQALPNSRIVSASRHVASPRALLPQELASVRQAIKDWEQSSRHPKSTPLGDILLFQLSTGLRISEALATTWAQVNLAERTLEVDASLRILRGGMVRTHTKTAAGQRPILLPSVTITMLERRAHQVCSEPGSPIFPSSVGTWLSPHNVRRCWREARLAHTESDLTWVVPHTMRKTAGTEVIRGHGLLAGATMLGHADTGVTQRHYLDRRGLRDDVTDVLDMLLVEWK